MERSFCVDMTQWGISRILLGGGFLGMPDVHLFEVWFKL